MKEIRLYYYNEIQNFGDALNPVLLERVFGLKTTLGTPDNADLCAIGSILEFFSWKGRNLFKLLSIRCKNPHPLNVYGSGFISEPYFVNKFGCVQHEMFTRKIKLHAVRGTYTKQRFELIFKKSLSNLVIGDPGLLASYLIDKDKIKKKYSIGIIPHHNDENDIKLLKLADKLKHAKIINMVGDPLDILNQICECETIASTAMHGLIVSDSLGIPNQWIKVSDKLLGGNYKFNDYYSVFNLFDRKPADLNVSKLEEITPEGIAENYKINFTDVTKIQENLIKAFPYK